MKPVLHWFRRDLRLDDNTALQAALDSGQPVIPVFIFDPAILRGPRTGAPRLKFMLQALHSLDETLQAQDTRLLIRYGKPVDILQALVEETDAQAVYFNRDYSPYARRRDAAVQDALPVPVCSYGDVALVPPGGVMKADGDPYVVYTPFMHKWKACPILNSVDFEPGKFRDLSQLEMGEIPSLADLGFDETIDVPEASETAAQARLASFVGGTIYEYAETRNYLASEPFAQPQWTAVISPYLRLGLLSPRRAYHAALKAAEEATHQDAKESVETWINELIWRDFYMHILYHYPHVMRRSFREEYDDLQWSQDGDALRAWKEGQTGYPLVDAAMRQLMAVGWMPNRARMIVASFLTKDLLVDWREGELHFMQWLVDGDPAANNGGWQWAAGTGTDAQPYFRIFNPVSQSKKYDPQGHYIRYWVPELRDVSDRYIHAPWEMDAPPANYPAPMVDHDKARVRTLDAYKALK
ncbi:MAG: DNA photolyase family protein [Anaerolineae bacterium]|nr:DNA photolyase family protein [Anaerolineae bacterium]